MLMLMVIGRMRVIMLVMFAIQCSAASTT